MKVLIADHSGALAARGVIFLSMWGHEVKVARDGLDALKEARGWRPDVLLAEVQLERMGGLALCAALAAHPDTHAARVLLVGSPDDLYTSRRGLALGAHAFLPAPLSFADLQRALKRLVAPTPAEPRRQAAHG